MFSWLRKRVLGGLAVAGVAVAFSASPAEAVLMQWNLDSHPDGAERQPTYMLRLDGLLSNDSNHVWTFRPADTNSMMATYDTDTNIFTIMGTLYGGLDIGSAWDASTTGEWDVMFTYDGSQSGLVSDVSGPGASDFGVTAGPVASTAHHTGTMTAAAGHQLGNVVVDLQDEDGGMGFSFKFNNTDDHRLGSHVGYGGPDDFVGWGWLNHDGGNGLIAADSNGRYPHIYSSDWLFVGTLKGPPGQTHPTPEPLTAALSVLGAGALAASVRRRRMA